MPHLFDISKVEPNPAALDIFPKSLLRECSVLPVSISDGGMHVILPPDNRLIQSIDRLRFVMNRSVTYDTAEESQITEAITRHYPRPQTEPTVDANLPDALPAIDEQGEFEFLDLIGTVTYKTIASVSFDLGQKSNVLELSDGTQTFYDDVFNVIGWLDAHFPCQGFHKLVIRCSLPPDYVSFESMRDLIPFVTQALRLPSEVSYKIHMESGSHATSMEHPQQGFVCTKKWRLPDDEDD
jgi:hypothetical protein